MGFLSYLMALLCVLPSLSLIVLYFFIDRSIRLYLCYALFFPALALTWLVVTDKHKARRNAEAEEKYSGKPR